jgi:hypothetical protein
MMVSERADRVSRLDASIFKVIGKPWRTNRRRGVLISLGSVDIAARADQPPNTMARSSDAIGASLKNAGWRRFQTRIGTDSDSVLERELDSNLRFRARAGSILSVRFVADPLLEGDGFEPSVPRAINGSFWWKREDF